MLGRGSWLESQKGTLRRPLSYPPLEPRMLETLVPWVAWPAVGKLSLVCALLFHSTLSAPHPQMFLFFYLYCCSITADTFLAWD